MTTLNSLLHVIEFWYAKESDVLWAFADRTTGKSTIQFDTGKDWTQLDLTGSESVFTEKLVAGEKTGNYHEQSFSGHIPVSNVVFPFGLHELFEEYLYIKLVLYNGETVILGESYNAVELNYELNSQEQLVKISFKHKSESPVLGI